MNTNEKRINFALLTVLRIYLKATPLSLEQRAFEVWAKAWLAGNRSKEDALAAAEQARLHAQRLFYKENPDAEAFNAQSRADGLEPLTPRWFELASKFKNPMGTTYSFPYGPYAVVASSHEEAAAKAAAKIANLAASWFNGCPEVHPSGWAQSAAEIVRLAAHIDWDLDLYSIALEHFVTK